MPTGNYLAGTLPWWLCFGHWIFRIVPPPKKIALFGQIPRRCAAGNVDEQRWSNPPLRRSCRLFAAIARTKNVRRPPI